MYWMVCEGFPETKSMHGCLCVCCIVTAFFWDMVNSLNSFESSGSRSRGVVFRRCLTFEYFTNVLRIRLANHDMWSAIVRAVMTLLIVHFTRWGRILCKFMFQVQHVAMSSRRLNIDGLDIILD